MKTIITILFAVALLVSCQEDPGPQMGCVTGISKTFGGDPVYVACTTREQYLAGNNVAAGGLAIFGSYTNLEWKATSDCDKCY